MLQWWWLLSCDMADCCVLDMDHPCRSSRSSWDQTCASMFWVNKELVSVGKYRRGWREGEIEGGEERGWEGRRSLEDPIAHLSTPIAHLLHTYA